MIVKIPSCSAILKRIQIKAAIPWHAFIFSHPKWERGVAISEKIVYTSLFLEGGACVMGGLFFGGVR